MKIFEKQIFDGCNIGYHTASGEKGPEYSAMRFVKCEFNSCSLSHHIYSPESRTVLHNISLVNCHQRSCDIGPAILENVLIDGLTTHGLLLVDGAVYDRVVLKGKIGRIFCRNSFPICGDDRKIIKEADLEKAFTKANREFYAGLESFALDISNADFQECDIRDIPVDLIRINQETQVKVRREKAERLDFEDMDFMNTGFGVAIRFMLDSDNDGVVLVAGKENKRRFSAEMHVIDTLRKRGMAE
jgi:hypothetical protein